MRFRFGSLVLIAEQRVLFDGDTRVPLAPKTFDILLLLLESAGEVVSREALRQRVWEGAHVDEAVVSRNLSLLRMKLRPYFGETEVVETISKRGYRFLIPVQIVDTKTEPDQEQVLEDENAPIAEKTSVPAEKAVQSAPRRLGLGSLLGWAALLGALVLVAVIGYRIRRNDRVHAEQSELAVIDFRDLSGTADAGWMGVALQESMSEALSRDGGLPAIEGDRVAVAEEDLGLLHARRFEASELDQLDKRLGVQYLLTGTYMPVGEQVRMDLVLHQGDKAVTEFSETVQRKDLQAAVERAGAQMRAALHLPPAQTGGELQFFGPQDVATHFYAEGLRLSRTGDTPRLAREAFSKAVAADPHFAEAHEALATAWATVGHGAESRAEAQLALDTCGSLPEVRRLSVQAAAYRQLRDYPKSLEAITRLRQLRPDDQNYKLRMALALLSSNRLPEATALLREMEADKTHPPNLDVLVALMRLLAGQGDKNAQFIYADKIMKLARAEGSRSAEALAHMWAGRAWNAVHDADKSVAEFQQARALYSQIGDTTDETLAMQNESVIRIHGHLPGGLEVGQRALDRAAEAGQDGTVAEMCINLGQASLNASRLRSAVSYGKRAEELGAVIESKHMQMIALEALTEAYLRSEQLPEAAKEGALELASARAVGTPLEVAAATEQLARISSYLGSWKDADAKYEEALATFRDKKSAGDVNDLLVEYSWMLLGRGEVARAREMFGRVDRGAVEDNASLAGYEEARLSLEAGEPEKAEQLLSTALSKEALPYKQAAGLDVLMEIAVRQKDAGKARAVAERYAALAQSIPEDGGARRGAVRAAAEVELLAGDRSGSALRQLPAVLREATELHHAVEVAELKRVLADSALKGPGI